MTEAIDWHDAETDDVPAEQYEPPAPVVRRPEPPDDSAPTTDASCQSERARVLRHPKIAARLCLPPLSYARPDQWSGYTPPPEWQGRHNDSARRAALLEIVALAVIADKKGET